MNICQINSQYKLSKYIPFSLLFLFFLIPNFAQGQEFQEEIDLLKVDMDYAYFQYHSPKTAKQFKNLFDKINDNRVVLFHFGASHIQAEVVTTQAKSWLHNEFGNAGPGFFFPFSAANTYSSVNYKTKHHGDWAFAKSFQLPPKIPLGPRGMTIETASKNAGFSIILNEPVTKDEYELILFFDNNDQTPNFELRAGDFKFVADESVLGKIAGFNFLKLTINQSIPDFHLELLPSKRDTQLFRFYGMSLEKKSKGGLLYQSLGVGASPFEAVIYMEKLKEQSEILSPDIVMLDYGTNNILYKNEVPKNMSRLVENAVLKFREINPNVIIVLTSTQDLFYKGRYIDAAVDFTKLMDSLAVVHDCMYWNFYDLSGGFAQIRRWNELGYAKSDHIHLTNSGYQLKGYLLYKSIKNTLNHIEKKGENQILAIPVKNYDELIEENRKKVHPKSATRSGSGTHVVKSGDTLGAISRKYGVSVKELKRMNNLKSDLIRIGQVLKVK